MTASVLALLLWSCAAQAPAQHAGVASPSATPPVRALSASAEKAIKTRAGSWWVARERRDHQRMYQLFEPAYRKQVSFADFLKESAVRTRFDLVDTHVDTVVLETPDRVRVRVTMETRPPGLPVGHVTAEDIWVRVSGQWYKLHEAVPLPFPTAPR